MSAAGIDLDFEQGELAEGRVQAAKDRVVRDGVAAAGATRGHAGAAYAVAADAGGNCSAIFLQRSVHESNVSFLDFAAGKLGSQLAMGFIVFRHDDQAAGFLIETVDNARTHFSSDGG